MASKRELKNGAAAIATPPGVNARGEAKLSMGEGRSIKLKMTLGVMADLEDVFGVESIADLNMERPSAKQLIKMVAMLAKAAGEEVTEEELRAAPIELPDVIVAIRAAAGGVSTEAEADAQTKNAPAPSA